MSPALTRAPRSTPVYLLAVGVAPAVGLMWTPIVLAVAGLYDLALTRAERRHWHRHCPNHTPRWTTR